jgi:hypothetical protein
MLFGHPYLPLFQRAIRACKDLEIWPCEMNQVLRATTFSSYLPDPERTSFASWGLSERGLLPGGLAGLPNIQLQQAESEAAEER